MPESYAYNPDFAPEESAPSTHKRMDPQNIQAEKSVLAACMLNQDVIEEVAPLLVQDNFYRPAHQRIYESMMDLYTRHIPIDHISLAENLQAHGQLEAIGGRTYLIDLADNTLALTNWRTHVDIIKRTAMLRDLIRASSSISQLAYDAPDDLNVVVEEAEKKLFAVTEKRVSSDFTRIDSLVTSAYDEISELARRGGQLAGVPTGFKDVDDLFHGLRGGDLIILAARPGMGKTALALNLAVNAAKAGTTVAFLSLEMSSSQLVQRILCSEARVNLSQLRAGKIQDSDWPELLKACTTLSGLNLYIDDTPQLSILELRAKARRELRGCTNGLIVVDYLQLMQPAQARRDGNRAVEVAEISRGLKVLAKEMNMPVIALSQLSRQIEQRGGSNKRPQLSDLRESGSIEQDADIVMFIDRSRDEMEAESEGRPDINEALLIVAKHRNGPIRDIDLIYDAKYTRFMSRIDDSRVPDGYL